MPKTTKKATRKVAPKKLSADKNQPMGIGPIGDAEIVFARKFRWTLRAEHLCEYFNKSVAFDYAKKIIRFSAYDIAGRAPDGLAILWAEQMRNNVYPQETLTFKNFDGLGRQLSQTVFSGLKIIEQTSDYDYESSEAAVQNIGVSYETARYGIGEEELTLEPQWDLQLIDMVTKEVSEWCHVKLTDRPSMNIEESEVNHLNATLYIPGRCQWQPIKFKSTKPVVKNMVSSFGKRYKVLLRYSEDNVVLETWTLENAWARKFSVSEGECDVHLMYDKVQYEPNLLREPNAR